MNYVLQKSEKTLCPDCGERKVLLLIDEMVEPRCPSFYICTTCVATYNLHDTVRGMVFQLGKGPVKIDGL